jgi:hypothetical protein
MLRISQSFAKMKAKAVVIGKRQKNVAQNFVANVKNPKTEAGAMVCLTTSPMIFI